MTCAAVTIEPLARACSPGSSRLLHEAGALVCVEGSDEAEALCAIDAHADLMQAIILAPPAPSCRRRRAQRDVRR